MKLQVNPFQHYTKSLAPIEFEELNECSIEIKNIGWTLGNDCPYRCKHCYSMSARRKGANLDSYMVDRIVDQFAKNGIETVNLGGNEPIFTNGLDTKKSLLPYIINSLHGAGILIGLTTAGITLLHLKKSYPESLGLLNDIDISLDSPFKEEHNTNRGANLYWMALESLRIAQESGIPHSIIMCAMSWNFTESHIRELVTLARKFDAYVRINPIKTTQKEHLQIKLSPENYYKGFSLLMDLCESVDLGEPPLATRCKFPSAKGCPCGRTSFRVHSITPDGSIPISPCVYVHDFKTGDLLVDDLYDIVRSSEFSSFRRRNKNPDKIEGCARCDFLESCRGGCTARSYLSHLHNTGERSLFVRDP
jgi:radical SAM protein with 4Fe4S-binding SPASM domain